MLLGILCDTECFFDLGWNTTNQAASSVFVKQRCLPYGVLSSVKKNIFLLVIAQFIDGGACVMYVETSVHY